MRLSRIEKGFSSSFAILVVMLFVLAAMVWGLWPKGKSFEDVMGVPLPWQEGGQSAQSQDDAFVSLPERLQIEEWITKNKLNQYGDPADTFYPGGSPLMDEATGRLMTRYEYLLKMHPDRPWRR